MSDKEQNQPLQQPFVSGSGFSAFRSPQNIQLCQKKKKHRNL